MKEMPWVEYYQWRGNQPAKKVLKKRTKNDKILEDLISKARTPSLTNL
jgi:hypothetical protein